MIVIEKNIPRPMHNRSKYPFPAMEVDDSFFLEQVNLRTISASASNYGKRHNKKFTCREVDGGVRVWRDA